MKNILVLLDLSTRSEQIAQLALNIAKQTNTGLLLCDAFSAPSNNAIIFEDMDGSWPFEDKYFTNIHELAGSLKNNVNNTSVNCITLLEHSPEQINKLIRTQNISMILLGVHDVADLSDRLADNEVMQLINHVICPVLLVPEHTDFKLVEKIAYLTDLRFCDTNVVNFLKAFNAFIFITHLSVNGIPDMDDSYAQRIVSDEIAEKVKYNKLFLRNIKGKNRKADLEKMIDTAGIDLLVTVSKKHQLLDLFLQSTPEKLRTYHQLPLLIMPYLNWHKA